MSMLGAIHSLKANRSLRTSSRKKYKVLGFSSDTKSKSKTDFELTEEMIIAHAIIERRLLIKKIVIISLMIILSIGITSYLLS